MGSEGNKLNRTVVKGLDRGDQSLTSGDEKKWNTLYRMGKGTLLGDACSTVSNFEKRVTFPLPLISLASFLQINLSDLCVLSLRFVPAKIHR